jgi:4-amino-4-deoxy-L-arabinose transferase-like glycosyltransferase
VRAMADIRAWLRTTDAQLVGLTLLVKALLFAWGLAVVALDRNQPVDIGQVFAIWNRWDAPHYLDLALFGYTDFDPGNLPMYSKLGDLDLFIVFFPLFPWATTLATTILPDLVAPIFVSTVASVAAVLLLYRLVAREFGERIGRRAAVFMLIFPTSYFLHIGYTESLFMALVLGSFLAARNDRWWLAGILGGLAALTRVNGLILVFALAAEAWLQWAERHRWRPQWAWISLVAAGFGGYLLLNYVVYGDPFEFLRIQNEHWFKSLAWPWEGIEGVLGWLESDDPDTRLMFGITEPVAIGLGLAATVVAALRYRPGWFVWMTGNWLLFVSTSFVVSVPRYTLTMFPIFAWFAQLAERRWLGLILGGVSVVLLLWLSARFATGAWAY